ncbi:uncharacterized protein A4U43_C08F3070 [Asparagus officinalis]|nr:uncharacterized protein A4U43_C08F3070 [Asparagus officinalis]
MDEFLMYTYKVKRCPRTRAHDWTECPYAHRGEKARRRDPRKFPYQGVVCPEFKNGECKKGQNCFGQGCASPEFSALAKSASSRTRPSSCGRRERTTACGARSAQHHRCGPVAAAAPAKEKAKKCEAPPPTAPAETIRRCCRSFVERRGGRRRVERQCGGCKRGGGREVH